jgi:hypothetical protein
LRAAFSADAEDLERVIQQDERKEAQLMDDRTALARSRKLFSGGETKVRTGTKT